MFSLPMTLFSQVFSTNSTASFLFACLVDLYKFDRKVEMLTRYCSVCVTDGENGDQPNAVVGMTKRKILQL